MLKPDLETPKSKRFVVTIKYYEDLFIEADSEEEASQIASAICLMQDKKELGTPTLITEDRTW